MKHLVMVLALGMGIMISNDIYKIVRITADKDWTQLSQLDDRDEVYKSEIKKMNQMR